MRCIIRGTALLFAATYVVSVSEQHLENVQRQGVLPSYRNNCSTGLLSLLFCLELYRLCSPTIRSLLMTTGSIPHFLSISRFLGRPQLLTRHSSLPTGRDIARL